ncbi:MAG: hypothetical protein ACOC22_00970 [bacterium]
MSNFFSRPNLDDLQFRQVPGSELSLSGLTRIGTYSGLTLTNGNGEDVLITLSGASTATTQGYVLTYIDGQVSLQASAASGTSTIFDTHRETTRSGIPTVCVGGDCSINNFLEGYFFPAVGPSSSLSIATGGSDREFGDDGDGILCYQAIRETNQICSVAIDTNGNGDYDEVLPSPPIAGDCCGITGYTTYSFSCATPPTGTTETSLSFGICVETVCNEVSTGSTSITWRNKRFVVKSSEKYSDCEISGILTSSTGELSTTKTKTICNEVFNNEFFYYVYPSSFGTPIFTVNGLQNNGWGDTGSGTLYKFDYTNDMGYENQYYVARSDNRITGTYNIGIT